MKVAPALLTPPDIERAISVDGPSKLPRNLLCETRIKRQFAHGSAPLSEIGQERDRKWDSSDLQTSPHPNPLVNLVSSFPSMQYLDFIGILSVSRGEIREQAS
jgi:hypothetical protein